MITHSTFGSYYNFLVWHAHPDTVNHEVTLADGSKKWMPITATEKAWYKRQLDNWHTDYANLLCA